MGKIREFFGLEKRESYTDTLVALLSNYVSGSSVLASISAAEASAMNLVSRSFMSAVVKGDSGLLVPSIMSAIGGDLIRSGQSVLLLMEGRLLPVRSWQILKTGEYQIDFIPHRLPAERARTVQAPRTRVLHVQSNLKSLKDLSADTTFLRKLEVSFSQESGALVGHVIPSPMPAEKMLKVQGQLGALKGQTTFLESLKILNSASTEGNNSGEDWSQRNFGPSLSEENSKVFESVQRAVLSSVGVPHELAGFDSAGTGRREAYRQFSHSTVQPLSRCLVEAMADLGRTVSLDFSALASADSQGRARALKSLVDSGMSLDEALIATGFLDADENE